MTKQEQLQSISNLLTMIQKELSQIQGTILTEEWKAIKASVSSANSFVQKANRQISELNPMEGQLNLMSYLDELEEESSIEK